MTWVKICGMTSLEDARVAVDAGADAVGFVFYEDSPRNTNPEKVRDIVAQLPETTETVGIFVNRPIAEILNIVERARLTAVQLYPGAKSGSVADFLNLKESCPNLKLILVCPADKLSQSGVLLSADATKVLYALLFDSGSGPRPGGSGKTFDWAEARGLLQVMSMTIPVIVAGGLNPLNVAEAISLFQPYGVDVVSGVERVPGKKDPEKVRAFVKAVRQAEQNH